MYDVILVHTSHLLLCRPWQYNMHVIYDGFSNRYRVVMKDKPITLVPLSPKQVFEEQMKVQQKRKKENERYKKKENMCDEIKEEIHQEKNNGYEKKD